MLKDLLPSPPPYLLLLRGKDAVLENALLLEQLALRCGQPGAMHWLGYFLSTPECARKTPYLVLITQSEVAPGALRLEDVRAAVILLEYRLVGISTGIFCTDDSSAFRTVVAPAGERAAVAALAAQALMQCGAQIAVVTYDGTGRPLAEPVLHDARTHGRPVLWAKRRRPVARTLVLEPTYAATLAKLGKLTRRNLKYYRRQLLTKYPCTFVEDARGMLTEAEIRSINLRSLNPIPLPLFQLQYASACQLPGGFVVGLRGPMGEWLSVMGGWRQGGNTLLYWQTNSSGYERDSLGTVMRSYFIESEVQRGTKTLSFYGGTPHSMQHSFLQEEATDLVVRRQTMRAWVLVALSRLMVRFQRLHGRVNFVAEVLSALSVEWRGDWNVRSGPLPASHSQATAIHEGRYGG